MSKDFTVIRYGTDSSVRPIFMTIWMKTVWEAMLADPRISSFSAKITIVQGAFMSRVAGGGADDSAGYHDLGGAVDVRTWNLTPDELNAFIAITDDYGFPFWRRDETWEHGGMDPHAHGILLSDYPVASGLSVQRAQYLRGENGLASGGPDYEKRDHPLALEPPNSLLQEDPMADPEVQKQVAETLKIVKGISADLDTFRTNEHKRDREAAVKAKEVSKRQIATLGGVVDALREAASSDDVVALKKRLKDVEANILAALAEDPDVDGPDNPQEG